jgi:hypothetical protein
MCVGGLFGGYGWLGLLLPRWCLGLRPAGACPRPEGLLWVSFWVASRGCFVELASTVGANVEICWPRPSKS